MNWGFPTTNKSVCAFDISQRKEKFAQTVKLSEKCWAEDQFQESLIKLRIAIKLGKFIVENEPEGPVKDSFIQKLTELAAREQDRLNQVKQGHPSNTNKTAERGIKGKTMSKETK